MERPTHLDEMVYTLEDLAEDAVAEMPRTLGDAWEAGDRVAELADTLGAVAETIAKARSHAQAVANYATALENEILDLAAEAIDGASAERMAQVLAGLASRINREG